MKTPWHLWVVAVITLLWNAGGAFDFVMTQTRNADYMAEFSTEQLDFFYGFPVWVVACWALAVWGAVAGSILLLMRRRWAVAVFSVSLGAMVITYLHNFVLAETKMQDVVGREAIWFSLVIAIFAVAVFFYALAMAQRGVLR